MPSIQSQEDPQQSPLNALLAAMLKSNDQLFNLYVRYGNGSFIEMDAIEDMDGGRARGWKPLTRLPSGLS